MCLLITNNNDFPEDYNKIGTFIGKNYNNTFKISIENKELDVKKNDFKYYKNPLGNNIGITITHNDGKQESVSLKDPQVVAWLAEGNTPTPADE
jgi:hypothetical protein